MQPQRLALTAFEGGGVQSKLTMQPPACCLQAHSPSRQPMASSGSSGCHASFAHSVPRTLRMVSSLFGSS